MRINNNRILLSVLTIALLLLISCGWPGSFKKQVKAIPDNIDGVETKINDIKATFNAIRNKEAFKQISKYNERENWETSFDDAAEEIRHARNVYKNDIVPLLKRNKKQDIAAVNNHMNRIKMAQKKAIELALKPKARADFLLTVIKEAPEMVKKAEDELGQINKIHKDLKAHTETVKKDYPDKSGDIDGRRAPIDKLNDESKDAYKNAKTQLASKDPDYAILGDGGVLVSDNLKKITGDDKALRAKLAELYKSYSKTLVDMKIVQKPWIRQTRYEWNNYSDWDTTKKTRDKVVYIEMKQYEQLEQMFAKYPNGWVTNKGRSWEEYIEDMDIEEYFYHKYTLLENGEKTDTDWEKVNEAYFEKHEDDLGMTILSKPYGKYESEVEKVAAPAGMNYVGNPKYGRWENGPKGRRRWSWLEGYGMYYLMFGSRRHYYYYDDWNHWRGGYRGSRPYYGRGNNRFYGTSGSYTAKSSRYQKSHYGKTGGFKRQRGSVRAAGASRRAGGPGRGK